jgi:hypothetical protein
MVGLALAMLAGAANAQQVITDPTFESAGPAGPSAGPWAQNSNNAGSPLCDSSCGDLNTPSGARSGDWWAWFGGYSDRVETGTLTQTVTIPPGPAVLQFYLLGFTQRTDALDTLTVNIDGTAVLTITSADIAPGGAYNSGVYVPVTYTLPSTAGGTRQIQFVAVTNGSTANPRLTNFFVDDVTLTVGSACYPNCDGSLTPPVLNAGDFSCFINRFRAAGSLSPSQQISDYANCDASTTPPVLNAGDFSCFLNRFRAGCP